MSADTARPVFRYFWSKDGKYILYIQDKGGNENFHAYAIDPTAKPKEGQDVPEARDLTPIEGVTVNFYAFPEKTPDILFSSAAWAWRHSTSSPEAHGRTARANRSMLTRGMNC